MTKNFYICLGFLITFHFHFAQFDYQTSTVGESMISLNPAASSSSEYIDVSLTHKKLWAGSRSNPQVQELAFDIPLNYNRLGIGGVISRSTLNVEENLKIMLSASYKIHLTNNNYLSFGFGAGNWNTKRDFSKLRIEDLSDINLKDNGALNVFDTWFGMLLINKDFNLGVSVNHLNRVSLNSTLQEQIGGGVVYEKNPIISIHGSAKKELNSNFTFEPFVLFRKADYNDLSLYYQTFLKIGYRDYLFFGPQVRNNTAGLGLGIAINEFSRLIKNDLQLFYSSEYNYREVNPGTLNHEIMLKYVFKRHKNVDKIKDQNITTNPKGF